MAAKGFKERVLIPALTEQEFSVREARAVIDAIFSSVKDALGRHEPVELPIGSFTALQNPRQRGWRFGKVVIFSKYQIKFRPSDELNLAAAAAPPPPPRPKRKKKPVKSDLTNTALTPAKPNPNPIDLTASAANASGSVQTALSKLPRPWNLRTLTRLPSGQSR